MKECSPLFRRLLPGALALSTATLGACSKSTPPVREPDPCKLQLVTVSIIASPDINRAENGEARPVQIRLYQLASDIRLENAAFDEIWKKDADTLKDDLIKVEELPIYPDSRSDVEFERDTKAQVVAPVALFREPRGRSWYTTFDLPPPPADGQCAALCKGPECDGGSQLTPHYYIWLDESRVDDGADHADDKPRGGIQHPKVTAEKPKPEGPPPAQKAPAP